MKATTIYSFLLLSFLFSEGALACNETIDSKKVMLFIDVNLSQKEVDTARKDACKRGEKFILHPDDPEINKIRSTYYKYLTKKEYYDSKCDDDTPACIKLEAEVEKYKDELDDFDFDPYEMTEEAVKKSLKSVKDKNLVISTLIVSGHDGGGEVSGDLVKGTFTKPEFFKSFDETFTTDEKNNLQTILLWGCYTGTYSETSDWKSQFPSAKAIVGFYDSAPLAIRPSSSDLMSDFLLKEEQLYTAADNAELKRAIQGLKSVLYVQPGMLINSCSEEDMYYAHYQNEGRRKTYYFPGSDADKQCQLVMEEWSSELKPQLENYLSGRNDIPEVIRGSAIRTIYGLVRQNEKCFKDNLDIDANQIGLLLFWHGVVENFSHKYADLLKEAQKEIDLIGQEYQALQASAKEALLKQEAAFLEYNKHSYDYLDFEKKTKIERLREELKEKDEIYQKIYEAYKDPQKAANTEILNDLALEKYHQEYLDELKQLHAFERKDALRINWIAVSEARQQAEEMIRKNLHLDDYGDIKLPVVGTEKYKRSVMVGDLRKLNNIFNNSFLEYPKDKYPNLEKLYKKMDNLLYQLDPSCMNFLEWHQYSPGKPLPKNQCEDK